ncbi:MAG: heme ABC transporter permease [Euryhalocaulis sp.]|uniref:heme ABC transporter permease n=1 Tax=Euryhalocaulis sp. TaxID=2744307 RepID=UPI0017B70BC6|nr:heme ABC transporter permease [Euryhalocaulis sp.]MBA4802889.1 heme ABC transporter permease [Euryhalocaulis sp.]
MFSYFSNPARFERLARPLGAGLGAAAALCLTGAAVWGLFLTPPDSEMGYGFRLIYVHVPAAWMAMFVYVFIAGAALAGFVWRHILADVAARTAAPLGALFTALALITGAVWGKPMWGAWWVWDARLTSVLILFFMYLGLMAIWSLVEPMQRAARIAGAVALLGVVNIPIIKFSVDWWAGLHQPATVIRMDGPRIDPAMLWPLLIMALGYTFFFGWAQLTRMRAALARRRAENAAKQSRPSRARLETREGGAE